MTSTESSAATTGDRNYLLADLIKQLENAPGNSWALDQKIFETVHFPTEFFGSKIQGWSSVNGGPYTVNTEDGIRHLAAFNAGNYTASLEVALSLVPKGKNWLVGRGRARDGEKLYGAMVLEDRLEHVEIGVGESDISPAIAMCIAALRATASLQDHHS